MSLDLTSLRNAVASLEAGLDVVGDATWFGRQTDKVKNTLIAGVADVEAWFQYWLLRNITAHPYDQAKARQVYEGTLRFIGDARDLLRRLEARNV